ncbi:unnamed protein product [Caenorhabditis auriculariae]|uniref:G-protein coupled receptors family 1 profile domain-containing protein n=1 Tax=Caenorhabditis auriculariae TaxID=2777116 RepID=A0A8S1GXB0_9PELO|nr:unnamed protein product [Caenorhabditis auriculariae]
MEVPEEVLVDPEGLQPTYELDFSYELERWMYGIAFLVGLVAFTFTTYRLIRTSRRDLVLAARLFSYKISLTVADSIVLFIYAPTQFLWITNFWWYGGDIGCRLFKFVATFGFHLTANMQLLVAADRLFITAKMNRMNVNVKKRNYNTRVSLAAAWLMALICALPQIFIFRQGVSEEGYPQCISIWTENRIYYMGKLLEMDHYQVFMSLYKQNSSRLFHPNMTLKVHPPPVPEFNPEELSISKSRWMFLEQMYNVMHLATICVLPYFLELLCYTLILYILKNASRGDFKSLRDVFQDWMCFCLRSSNSSNCDSANTQETQSLVTIAMRSRTQTENESRSYESNRRRATSLGEPMAISSVQTDDTVNYHQAVRRKSELANGAQPSLWANTVEAARRKARWKAFVMLSMNLLFWAPYCVLGVVSAVTVFEGFAAFQFVCALVVFNAISNILL